MTVDTVITCPAWDRSWCFDLWMDSLLDNVDPARTGLAFVVPSADTATRAAIAERTDGFAWVEVVRDRLQQASRLDRHEERHGALAAARNQALAVAIRARPRWVMAWDVDVLLPPGSVDELKAVGSDHVAAWAWLNRAEPRRMHYMSEAGGYQEVLWQHPPCFTAMRWSKTVGRPEHYPAEEFVQRQGHTWECAVATGAVLMTERAFRRGRYAAHHDGAHVPFCHELERAGVRRDCAGGVVGVHLYDRQVRDERKLGWPDVMSLADQAPLAATWPDKRTPEFEALGFYESSDWKDTDG